MKSFLKEYLDIMIYLISGVVLVFGSYNIIININHGLFLNQKIVVSETDNDYQEFKNNILKIEKKIQEDNINNQMIVKNLKLLKESRVYHLLPKEELKYRDLYELNNYFIEELINEGWISSLKLDMNINNTLNNEYMNILIKDANYLNKELLNNSNYHYDKKDNDVRNGLMEEYTFILKNYYSYSSFIWNLCNQSGDSYA